MTLCVTMAGASIRNGNATELMIVVTEVMSRGAVSVISSYVTANFLSTAAITMLHYVYRVNCTL